MGYGRGNTVVRNHSVRYIVPVKTFRKKATKQISNVNRGVGGDIFVADKVWDGGLGGLGFYIAPKTFPGRSIVKQTSKKVVFGILNLIGESNYL